MLTSEDRAAYPYIVAWGKLIGSTEAWVAEQVGQARADAAPRTAIRRRRDGNGPWWTVTDLKLTLQKQVTAKVEDLGLKP